MARIDFVRNAELEMELGEEIMQAEEDAAESHKMAMNSYGAGYDAGYLAGLRRAAELCDIDWTKVEPTQ